MASDEKLKGCPFCGEAPMDDETGLYCVSCGNSDCVIADRWMSATDWNRRAPAPGAVKWWACTLDASANAGIVLSPVKNDVFNRPVEVRPVEGE